MWDCVTSILLEQRCCVYICWLDSVITSSFKSRQGERRTTDRRRRQTGKLCQSYTHCKSTRRVELMKKILTTKWNISHLMSRWCPQTVLETDETGWSKTFKWITQRLGGSSVFSLYFYFPQSDDFLFHLHFYWTSAYGEISCRVESIGSSLRLDNILGGNRQ